MRKREHPLKAPLGLSFPEFSDEMLKTPSNTLIISFFGEAQEFLQTTLGAEVFTIISLHLSCLLQSVMKNDIKMFGRTICLQTEKNLRRKPEDVET